HLAKLVLRPDRIVERQRNREVTQANDGGDVLVRDFVRLADGVHEREGESERESVVHSDAVEELAMRTCNARQPIVGASSKDWLCFERPRIGSRDTHYRQGARGKSTEKATSMR